MIETERNNDVRQCMFFHMDETAVFVDARQERTAYSTNKIPSQSKSPEMAFVE